jgi:enamine deaminase RidA (YjgF/YER057c/UK114 family)
MFATAARLLEPYQTKFTEVLRTWCYLKEIDDDYAEFNLSRNAFFTEHGVRRLPASTGIRAGLWPDRALCGMDLYALLDTDGVGIEVMHTPTLNEADEYGSSFSRGMKIDLPEKTVLHVSGTASINEMGETVHVGDPQKQLERMLVNVRELLNHQGASFEDVAQIATFLKHAEYYDACQRLLREWGIRHVPNTFVEAGVCRPELLCEMEAIAILPK